MATSFIFVVVTVTCLFQMSVHKSLAFLIRHRTIGCLIDSCRSCDNCAQDLENYCPKPILTYNSLVYDDSTTFGGFSDKVVIDHHYVLHFPNNLPLYVASPLLCAGIIVYNPMKYFGFSEPGKHLGVVGLGGLGHMAIKFGKAFGLMVSMINTLASKEKEVLERLGADSFLVSRDPDQMQVAMATQMVSSTQSFFDDGVQDRKRRRVYSGDWVNGQSYFPH
ncbi:probable mannitol dehydrogenase [Macadamia integrifolia]|uniref:probable mannitol dehydrogenase n=1 Tax=Macadamia integrifolia TaxID=60698 RepID=UPI001C527969|nr:probable mannitol dehydrogenase [Macadamia integrifolia]